MQTIKTAVVVVLLLSVLYGAYVALNTPPTELPPGLDEIEAELNLDPPSSQPFGSNSGSSSIFVPPAGGLATAPPSIPTFPGSTPSTPESTGGDKINSVIGLPPTNPNIPAPAFAESTKPPISTGDAFPAPETTAFVGSPSIPSSPSLATASLPDSAQSPTASSVSVPSLGNNTTPPVDSTAAQGSTPSSTSGLQVPAFPALAANNQDSANSSNVTGSADGSNSKDSATSASNTSVSPSAQSFENARKLAMEQIERGKLKEALFTLSMFYSSPELTHDQHTDLLAILDALSGEVIYSRRHLLEDAYKVTGPVTLEQIASQYNVPADILAKVNGVENPNVLLPGTELKVFKGPFRSEIDITTGEMTLFLDQLYAGRFPISLGEDPAPREGSYTVQSKQRNRSYYGSGGNMIPADDPKNPLGDMWIDLGQDLYIHGSPKSPSPALSKAGCVSLSPMDAEDVYSMLSRGSRVRIHR